MAKNNHNDVWEAIREIQEEIRDSHRETQKEMGRLVNAQGYLVEGLIAPAISNIFGVTEIHRRAKSSLNSDTMEVDVIGIGRDIMVVTEITSRLKKWDVDDLLDKLPRFTKFFPRYKDLKIIGVVGGVNIDEGVDKYAEGKGLCVLVPSGDTMKLANTKNFKPKYF